MMRRSPNSLAHIGGDPVIAELHETLISAHPLQRQSRARQIGRRRSASPALLENKGLVASLTFSCELLASTHIDSMPLQVCKARQFIF
jgi:hypothetical protein